MIFLIFMAGRRQRRNNRLTKKPYFFFSDRHIARIFFKKSHSNFYLTLTDLRYKVIMCYSAGSVVLGTRRKILSKFSVETLIQKMLPYFRLYKINSFDIIVKSLAAGHIYTLANVLKAKGFGILSIKDRVPIPHNGIRGEKIPRK
jgi:ribosomal protein S11